MDDLVAFFTDRLTELEFGAKHRSAHHVGCAMMTGGAIVYGEPATCDCRVSEYLLADIEVKRRIVELHSPRGGYKPPDDWYGDQNKCQSCGGYELVAGMGDRGYRAPWPCLTARLLVQPFAWHPDYRAEWKP